MKSVMVSSSEAYSGKSAVCLGLGLNLVEKKRRVGYMKPVGNLLADVDGTLTDDDVINAKKILELDDRLEDMSPVLLTENLVYDTLSGAKKNLEENIKKAFKKISKGKDVMILEGAGDLGGGAMLELSDPEVAEITNSKILLISKYDSEYVVDRILNDFRLIDSYVGKKFFGGVIINDIPEHKIKNVSDFIIPFLEKKHIRVLGMLPKDPILSSVTVREVKEELNAKVLAGTKNLDRLINSFMVGAMSPSHALKYLRKSSDKAVITGGDRSDILMAALETPTRCLILTGNLHPTAQVLARAEEKKIPTILSPYDTLTTIEKVDGLVKRIRAKGGVKLERIKKLIEENIDFERFEGIVGL